MDDKLRGKYKIIYFETSVQILCVTELGKMVFKFGNSEIHIDPVRPQD